MSELHEWVVYIVWWKWEKELSTYNREVAWRDGNEFA